MNNEIKEILKDDDELLVNYKDGSFESFDTLPQNVLDYITDLQEDLKSANESITWWTNRFKAVEKENKRLKDTMAKIKDLNTMPYLRDDIFKEHLNFILQGENNNE